MERSNMMNWMQSRKSYTQAASHPAHRSQLAANAFDALFKKESRVQGSRNQLEVQCLQDQLIQQYAQRAQSNRRIVA